MKRSVTPVERGDSWIKFTTEPVIETHGAGGALVAESAGGAPRQGRADMDSYLSRAVKYIPAEVVAFFIFVNSLIPDLGALATSWPAVKIQASALAANLNALREQGGTITPLMAQEAQEAANAAAIGQHFGANGVVAVVMFALAWIMAPLHAYLITRNEATPPHVQVIMAVIAFPVWAYAIKGEFIHVTGWEYNAAAAGCALAFFTLVSGLVVPVNRVTDPASEVERRVRKSALYQSHPDEGFAALDMLRAAEMEADRYERAQMLDGNGAAFRTAWWSFLMARSELGPAKARRWTHEASASMGDVRKAVLRDNAALGRNMARDTLDAEPEIMMRRIAEGAGRRMVEGAAAPTDGSGRL